MLPLDRNIFFGGTSPCSHYRTAFKTVDHLATKCNRILGHDYIKRHKEVARCIHLSLCNKYGLRSSKKLKTHSVQEAITNKSTEIRVDTRIKTDIKIKNDRLDLIIFDKKRRELILIEIGITNLGILSKTGNMI